MAVLRRLWFGVFLMVAMACGSHTDGGVLAGGGVASNSPAPASRTLPPEDPTLRGCMADWVEGFRSLAPMVDRADLIVGARVVSTAATPERGGLTGYRTSLNITRTLKGATTSRVTVIETACPVVYGGPSEWVLFLTPKLDDTSAMNVIGGIQGAFPVRAGRVTPVYRDADVVRSYTGADVTELERDIAAITPLDAHAVSRLRAAGWTVAGKQWVQTYEVAAAASFGETKLPPRYELPFDGYARVSATTGLDLRPYGGREVEQLVFYLEHGPGGPGLPLPLTAWMLYVDRSFIGGWVQSGWTDIFRIDDRAKALAAPPAPPGPPAPTPAVNRYPTGVNVVREYGLAGARSAYVKPLTRDAQRPPDSPSVASLVAVLDRTLATEPAPPRRDVYWVIGFELADAILPFEFYPDDGLLVQRDDGYAIRPGPDLARLVGAAR